MNMPALNRTDLHDQHKPVIAEAIFAVEAVSAGEQSEKQLKAKAVLDNLFPLDAGSHQDVTCYVIDYRHLLAYFKDGSHCGLKDASHFVAFSGEKEDPCAILLRDGSGCHLELSLGCRKGSGAVELVEIEDIQLESCTTFSQGPALPPSMAAMRHWISLIKGDGKPQAMMEDKEFTAKCGADYYLDYSFTL
ncbi:MAG: hypothetical protein VX447_09050 [Pseudomonadota bacterium]|uniref:Malate synthase n=2 Tax=Gallaecimonas pentaromativorans TaxID=584787 RepID=A0A3N1PA84_9GAMM|nr:malate synthase [Gallaecimonas pentaromativorans]MED5524884.1 hypothetical protein [Pseudomonadota bacterium]ROQ24331.1 malate synthase [Gallaecimonas pentaromativorans]